MTRRRIDHRHPDARSLIKLADRMRRDAEFVEQLATDTDAAFTHLESELDAVGFPMRGGDHVKVSGGGGDGLTAVERDAERSWELSSTREDVRDQVGAVRDRYNDLCGHLKALATITRTAQRKGLAKVDREMLDRRSDQQLCSDNQIGKHGVDEWGDPFCMMPSVKQGLCQQHYDAWRYRRQRDGIDVTRDYGQAS